MQGSAGTMGDDPPVTPLGAGPRVVPPSGDADFASAPAGVHSERAAEPPEDRSLVEDLEALYHDGRTYAAAEMAFQKTRASYAADRMKQTVMFGAVAAVAALLAAIGLTVGLILCLIPLIGPWLATALVVAALLLVAYLCVSKAAAQWSKMMSAFSSDGTGAGEDRR